MRRRRWTRAPAVIRHAPLIALCLLAAACGKKGAPLPPLQRIPAAPADFAVSRVEDTVYITFAVPSANVDGAAPADVARIEVYAVTADVEPPAGLEARAWRDHATLIFSETVRRPLPPLPPPTEGAPPPPPLPAGPGVDQGAVVVVRDVLTAENRVPIAFPGSDRPDDPDRDAVAVPGPLIAPVEQGVRRFYFAVAVSGRGRYGPHTAVAPAPLGPTSSAPAAPEVEVAEDSVTIRWTPPADARGTVAAAPADLLPARPVVPGPPPTTYDVYEVSRNAPPDAPVAMPAPLTPAPVGELEFTQTGISLGAERCYFVRPVDIVSGLHVRGPASPVVCAAFADTFPPSPPGRLDAVATAGVISLIWEASAAADLAGYLVLRGDAGGATLAPLTPAPIVATTYRDESVTPGQRYVYAVVAVDKAGNRSAESNRVEETARQE